MIALDLKAGDVFTLDTSDKKVAKELLEVVTIEDNSLKVRDFHNMSSFRYLPLATSVILRKREPIKVAPLLDSETARQTSLDLAQ